MLDLAFVRDHIDLIRQMTQNRGVSIDLDSFQAIDDERRHIITQVEGLKALRNRTSEDIGRRKQAGEDVSSLAAEMKEVSQRIRHLDEKVAALEGPLRQFLLTIPNLPQSSVPLGRDSRDNVEVRRWGQPPQFDFTVRPHWEVAERARILDLARAARIAGARFALYQGLGAKLERALANFFLDIHTSEHGYTEFLPPFVVNTESLVAVGQLPKFAGDMFHLEATDWWMTPTAEVELTNLYRGETLDASLLPIRVCAWTACFRSEAGAAGRDTRGIIRQHQFQKVEMYKFTRPEQSGEEHERLVRDAEDILQRLGLHHRVVELCTGDLGFASTKTYDVEVWMPSTGTFMEISSCSNCQAFQARRAGIRYRLKGGRSDFVHTLNGSGLAVGRTWAAIVENFQQSDGSVLIPEALRPFLGTDCIPVPEKEIV